MGGDTVKRAPHVMITNKRSKMSLIHIAKERCGLDDASYRALLYGAAGIESARDMEWEDQFIAIMDAFGKLGFQSWKKEGKTNSRPRWTDEWGCHAAQRAKIEVMWKTCARNKDEAALRSFIRRIAHVDSPRFLNPVLARKVIIALEKMMIAEGYDPVSGGRLATAGSLRNVR